jgi:LPXTG-motif cell wall-anchored protein
MRKIRIAAGATALSLIGALTSMGSAAAAGGVGTTQVSTTILDASVGTAGSVLGVRLLGDDARATVDGKVAKAPEAFSRLSALTLTSGLVPALNTALPAPPMESRTPGGLPCDERVSLSLGGAGVPGQVATGDVTPAKLCSAVDAAGARADLDTSLTNLSIVGGLLTVDSVTSKLNALAGAQGADGTRGVKIDAITVLDLGALLNGLGIDLADLPISTVSNLLSSLGKDVAGIDPNKTLADAVVALNDAIDTLQSAGATITDDAAAALAALLAPVGIVPPAAGDAVDAAIDRLQGLLGGVLVDGLSTLNDLKLLEVNGAEISVGTKATDSVDTSKAAVTAKVGDIYVGGIKIPGLDLASAAQKVNETVYGINQTLKEALGQISPDLENVVNISMFDKVEEVKASGGYVRSRAGLTLLSASIQPPTDLVKIVTDLTDGLGIGDAIEELGSTVPGLDSAMTELKGTLTTTTAVLAGGATVKVAEVLSASDYSPTGGSTGKELPRTGGETASLAILFGLVGLLGIGVRRTVLANRI